MTPAAGRLLLADRFHTGVRLTAMALWFVSLLVVYALLHLIVQALFGPLVGIGVLLLIVVAVVVAQPLAYLAEKQLMRRWPSGRAMLLEPGLLVWREPGSEVRLDLRQTVNFWRWRFAIKRRRGGRIPAGHHLFALRLVQGDTVVSLYTFLAPAAAETLAAACAFYELRRPSEHGKLALGGREALYLTAEDARWRAGAELDPADFQALLDHLAAHLPEFGRAPASGL
ncbi:MAG: hypothetical protein IT317_17945 [Anaerolineales bacterium]|nr:hypothetical protein [Anaerolineales bacterium]